MYEETLNPPGCNKSQVSTRRKVYPNILKTFVSLTDNLVLYCRGLNPQFLVPD